METQVINVPRYKIVPGRNHRKVFDKVKLQELATSIQTNGLAQPVIVRTVNNCGRCGEETVSTTYPTCPACGGEEFVNPHFEIVAGERRFRAISLLGWDDVPCIIRELDDRQARDIMLVENTGRVDLNPIEEAEAYHEHQALFNCPIEEVAQVAGKSADLVKRRISLRKLVDDIKALVAGGQFPIGHAEAITDLDANRQRIAVRIYSESNGGMSLSVFRGVVSQLLEEQSQDSLFDLESFWVKQVQLQAELPKRGKRAVTGAPSRGDLPPVEIGTRDNQAVIIDRYIARLLKAGKRDEAAAIGTLYNALVRTNYMAVPMNSELMNLDEESEEA